MTRDQEREFSDFPMWGRVGAGTTLDEASAAYFHDEEALARIQELRRYACSHRGCGVQVRGGRFCFPPLRPNSPGREASAALPALLRPRHASN